MLCSRQERTVCCWTEHSLEGVGEAGRDKDTSRIEIDVQDAVLDHRQCSARVELQHVVRDARRNSGDAAEVASALLDDGKAHELEDVVLVVSGCRQPGALHFEPRAPWHAPVELDHRAAGRTTGRNHLDLAAACVETHARAPPALVLARLLDEERSVESVRATDPTDPHSHDGAARSVRSRRRATARRGGSRR